MTPLGELYVEVSASVPCLRKDNSTPKKGPGTQKSISRMNCNLLYISKELHAQKILSSGDADSDGDGVKDSEDADDDNDGLLDVEDADDDGDGVEDEDEDLDGDGISNEGKL